MGIHADKIRSLLSDGWEQVRIVEYLGCSKSTVSFHARNLGLAKDKPAYNWGEVQAFYDLGHSLDQCIERFGFSRSGWYQVVKRGEIVTRPRERTPRTPRDKKLHAAEVMEDYRERRQRSIALLGGKCVWCGSTEDLEFDHVDPSTKSFTLASHSSCSEERWYEELAKCQLLCRPCHTQKTIEENYEPRTHGTPAMYKRGKCRCALCRMANTISSREYRRERKLRDPDYRKVKK